MTTLAANRIRLFASPATWIDGEAFRQLYAVARLEGVRHVAAFPDLHPGENAPVGAAFVTEDVIYPRLIGGDIGCGMTLFASDLPRRKLKLDRWSERRFDLEHPWEGDTVARLDREGLCATQFARDFGTLGGGNHFAELQAVEKVFDREAFAALGLAREQLAVLVHSGSRGFGQVVFEDYIEEHGAGGATANSEAATRYRLLHDHAVRWAAASRAVLAERFLETLGARGRSVIDACHNSLDCRELDGRAVWLHRNGAAPADRGAVVIAGTRGTLTYLVQPVATGFASAWSLAHGAGRKWSRTGGRARVRQRFHHDALVRTGLGGRVICEDRHLLFEEAPMAYKDIDVVVRDLVDTGLVSIIATLRPLLTYKTRVLRR